MVAFLQSRNDAGLKPIHRFMCLRQLMCCQGISRCEAASAIEVAPILRTFFSFGVRILLIIRTR